MKIVDLCKKATGIGQKPLPPVSQEPEIIEQKYLAKTLHQKMIAVDWKLRQELKKTERALRRS